VKVPWNTTQAALEVTWTPVNALTSELRLFVFDDSGQVAGYIEGPSPLVLDMEFVGRGVLMVYAYPLDVVDGIPLTVNDVQRWHLEATVPPWVVTDGTATSPMP
jgi:hypothetical protein